MADYFTTEMDKQINSARDYVRGFLSPKPADASPVTAGQGVGRKIAIAPAVPANTDTAAPPAQDTGTPILTEAQKFDMAPQDTTDASGTSPRITGRGVPGAKSIFTGIDANNDATRRMAVQGAAAQGHVFTNADTDALYPDFEKGTTVMSPDAEAQREKNIAALDESLNSAARANAMGDIQRVASGQIQGKPGELGYLISALTQYVNSGDLSQLNTLLKKSEIDAKNAATKKANTEADYLNKFKGKLASSKLEDDQSKIEHRKNLDTARDKNLSAKQDADIMRYAIAKGIPYDKAKKEWEDGNDTSPASAAPVPGAQLAPDGKWYVPDPNRPGKYMMVEA